MAELKLNPIRQDLKEDAEKIVALVEATEKERISLWSEYNKELEWDDYVRKYMLNICTINLPYEEKPLDINIIASENTINDKQVIFWYPCTRLVDYQLIATFLNKNFPNARVNTDAMNFRHVANLLTPKLKVKEEKLATRCEICHKADLFDPEKNFCSRCENLTIPSNRMCITLTKVSYVKIAFSFMAIVVFLEVIKFVFPSAFAVIRFPIATLFALCLGLMSLGKMLCSVKQQKERERTNKIAGRHIIMF